MRMFVRWFFNSWLLLLAFGWGMQSHAANLQIPVGDSHNCVVLSNGTAQCWGNNANGQLGNGNTTHSAIPVAVNGVSNAKMLSTGYYHTCALLATGAVQFGAACNF